MTKKTSVLFLILALLACASFMLFVACEDDDDDDGEATATPTPAQPTPTPTPEGPTPTPGPGDNITGCYDLVIAVTSCTGEPESTCSMIPTLASQITGLVELIHNEDDTIDGTVQIVFMGSCYKYSGTGTYSDGTMTFETTVVIEDLGITLEVAITATVSGDTINGTVAVHGFGSFAGTEFDCTCEGTYTSTKIGDPPCDFEC